MRLRLRERRTHFFAFALHFRKKWQRHRPHRLAHEAREHVDEAAGTAEERDRSGTNALAQYRIRRFDEKVRRERLAGKGQDLSRAME